MFLAIEGIDGAGKTSVSKILADKLNYEYSNQKALSAHMGIPNSAYLDYCHTYRKSVNADSDSMFMLYSLSCFLSGRKINVVCDRHLPTVYFWYGNKDNLFIADAIYKLTSKPDITIVLEVSVDTAIERVQKKLKNKLITELDAQREFEKAQRANEFILRVIPFLEHFELPYVIIDANDNPIDTICESIMNIVADKMLIKL